MTKKGRKKRFLRSFFVNVYECEQKFIFTDKNIDKVNKKSKILVCSNKKQKLKIMKKGGVKTSEDGEKLTIVFY